MPASYAAASVARARPSSRSLSVESRMQPRPTRIMRRTLQPEPRSDYRGPMPVRDTARFFALTYAITWIAMIPVVLAFRGLAVLPQPLVLLGALIGSCGPTIAALILVVTRG